MSTGKRLRKNIINKLNDCIVVVILGILKLEGTTLSNTFYITVMFFFRHFISELHTLDQGFSNFLNLSTTYIYGKKHTNHKKSLFQLYVYILIKKVNVKYDFVYLNIFVLYQAVFR